MQSMPTVAIDWLLLHSQNHSQNGLQSCCKLNCNLKYIETKGMLQKMCNDDINAMHSSDINVYERKEVS